MTNEPKPEYWREVAGRLRAAVAASQAARGVPTKAKPKRTLRVVKGGKA
jgi:hypothetical protein